MIRTLALLTAEGTNPYRNLALEEALLRCVGPDECILYLWQNRRTVVVGRNQNCWKECRVSGLEADGGFLARRLSGGGAVFHDLGNLNFTFLAGSGGYDAARQTEVVLRAVRSLGIPAEATGRNDLTVENRKFSGNAYYHSNRGCYQHGTLLVRSDGSLMTRYLTVSREKLRSKSVASVRARVCNLAEYCPALTVERMRSALCAAFGEVYGLLPAPFSFERVDAAQLRALEERYASPAWKYGRKIPFDYEVERRFPWGSVQIRLEVKNGKIAGCRFYTDALDAFFPARLRGALTGTPFTASSVQAALDSLRPEDAGQAEMREDIAALMRGSM